MSQRAAVLLTAVVLLVTLSGYRSLASEPTVRQNSNPLQVEDSATTTRAPEAGGDHGMDSGSRELEPARRQASSARSRNTGGRWVDARIMQMVRNMNSSPAH